MYTQILLEEFSNQNFKWYWEQGTFSYNMKQEMSKFGSLHWQLKSYRSQLRPCWNAKLQWLQEPLGAPSQQWMFLPWTRFEVVEKKEKGCNKHLDGRKTTGLQSKVVNMTKRRRNCLVRAPREQQRGQNCWLATTRVISPDRTLQDLSLSLSLIFHCNTIQEVYIVGREGSLINCSN